MKPLILIFVASALFFTVNNYGAIIHYFAKSDGPARCVAILDGPMSGEVFTVDGNWTWHRKNEKPTLVTLRIGEHFSKFNASTDTIQVKLSSKYVSVQSDEGGSILYADGSGSGSGGITMITKY